MWPFAAIWELHVRILMACGAPTPATLWSEDFSSCPLLGWLYLPYDWFKVSCTAGDRILALVETIDM
ncbi:Pre-mRNA-splicing factor SF2 -like protein [Sesbania bispinosa]|nr:Pre-mRNA-splicing factor SF2 -like protein [Sesbania bispinosa]